MANGNVALAANTWVQIADSGLLALSFQNKTSAAVYIAGTSANSEPTGEIDEWPRYEGLQGESAINATELFSGVSAVAYIWAYCPGQAGEIWRSHA